jgi:hypothetical protein
VHATDAVQPSLFMIVMLLRRSVLALINQFERGIATFARLDEGCQRLMQHQRLLAIRRAGFGFADLNHASSRFGNGVVEAGDSAVPIRPPRSERRLARGQIKSPMRSSGVLVRTVSTAWHRSAPVGLAEKLPTHFDLAPEVFMLRKADRMRRRA